MLFLLRGCTVQQPQNKSSIPMSTTHDEMRNEILSVITNKIPQGACFDAHAVIEFIEKNNNPLYQDFCNGHEKEGAPHGRMSRIITLISEEPDSPIEFVGQSWSANINGNFDNAERKCFRKL